MAKKVFLVGLIFVLMMSMATPGYCDNVFKKLGRGICNVITCPVEIFVQPSRVNNSDGPMAAFTYGILQGVAMTCFRGVVGVYEIATFPIPIPKGYGPILTNPEFFLEDMSW